LSAFDVLFTSEDINKKVGELADLINSDYSDKHPVVIGTLKGSFIFMSDLLRKLNIPVEIDFVRLSSYGSSTETSGQVQLTADLQTSIKDRHVLVIEDIVDTGLTVRFLIDYLSQKQPSSIKICSLCDKPSRRVSDVPVDYLGFTVPDAFIVGYGIDWDEKFRCLPDICALKETE